QARQPEMRPESVLIDPRGGLCLLFTRLVPPGSARQRGERQVVLARHTTKGLFEEVVHPIQGAEKAASSRAEWGDHRSLALAFEGEQLLVLFRRPVGTGVEGQLILLRRRLTSEGGLAGSDGDG